MGASRPRIRVPESLFLPAVRINIHIYCLGCKVSKRRGILCYVYVPYAREFSSVQLRAGVHLVYFHICISCHSLSQKKRRDYPQHLNSASWGPAGSCPLRSHYTYNTGFLLLKNFTPEFQKTLSWPYMGVHQSAFIWRTHKASLSVSFLLFLCIGGSNSFKTSGVFQTEQNFRTPSASLGKAKYMLPRQLI